MLTVCFNQFKSVISGVSQKYVLGLLLFILYTSDMWKTKIISYADDTILYAEVISPSDCINVANSLNRLV